ncbi:MAG: peptidase S53 [Acidobacteriaceae bacterium]|nr:peptidase S53 [Acidobacteriaceae bacterium]MBV9780063.1 peptidase S53 [Acidobacteriaceae bacterium]
MFAIPIGAQQRRTLETRLAATPDAQLAGRLAASERLNLAITLSLRNRDELDTLLGQLYDPGSPNYRQFLSVEQFTEQFGPTTADYEKVINFVTSYGLTVTNRAANRLVLDVSGTVAEIEQAFKVTMQVYRHPTENRTYYAPDVEPSVEMGIPVTGISGLNNFAPPRPVGLKYAAPGASFGANQTGSGPGGQFLGSDMRAAYAPGVTLDGSGQAIGLFEFGPYNLSDVENYFSTIHQPLKVPIVNVLLDGVNGICGMGCDDGEEVIDMEQAISMAPNLSLIVVYEGNNDTDMLNQMATDNIAKQLSCSFGWLPADPASDEPIFKEFAAQGQNLFVASGDSGAYSPPSCTSNCNVAFYPEDDPYITAAGGTHLTTKGAGGPWESEIAWFGSSGGYSTNGFSIPKYQVPAINSSNHGSKTLRNVPDVAAEADTDNYFCANGSCQGGVGGTSLSAPRWAGFLALANQQADGFPIGFLNPIIYAIGRGSKYDEDFHDIVSGNNFNSGSPDLFQAVDGYDLVTGWGSPNGRDLLNALGPVPTGPNFAVTASPDTLKLKQGEDGTSEITVTFLNGFHGTVDLTVAILGQHPGVTAHIDPASITSSGVSTLTVTTTGEAPGGNLPIVITGRSGGVTQTAYVTLALPGFTLITQGNVFLNQRGAASSAITISDLNGFDDNVELSISGLPPGVRASFEPACAKNKSKLELSAISTARTGFAAVTITARSGNLTQTAGINLAVSAASGTGGIGKTADLSAAYNVAGIYTDGATYSSGGLDGDGYSYSANLLTQSRVLSGVQFRFGPANRLDAVSGTGDPIKLPEDHFSTLMILATGVNGSQTSQPVTVTYTDGTTSQFTQSFSDWFVPQFFRGEIEAVAMPYRDQANGGEDNRTFNLYGYTFHLDHSKTVKSLTLPNNRNLVVLAATLGS